MVKVLKQKWEQYLANEALKRALIEDLKVIVAVSIAVACFLTFLLSVGCSGDRYSPQPKRPPKSDTGTSASVTAKVPPPPSPNHGNFCVSCNSRKEGW